MDFSNILGIQSRYVKQQQSEIDVDDNTRFFDSNDAHEPHSNYVLAKLCQNKSNNIKYNLKSSLSKSSLNRNMDDITHLYQKFNNNKNTKNRRSFHICHSLFHSIVFVIIMMTLSVLFIFESNTELFDCIRNAPEITVLRDDYYLPLKKFIKGKVIN